MPKSLYRRAQNLEVPILGNRYCWVLKASSGEGLTRYSINDINAGSQVKGIMQTHLFICGENLIYPLSTQAFRTVDLMWQPLTAQAQSTPLTVLVARPSDKIMWSPFIGQAQSGPLIATDRLQVLAHLLAWQATSAFGRLRQDDQKEFKDILGYIAN